MVSYCGEIIARNTSMGAAPASALGCDIAWLNSVLFVKPPKAHGLERRTFDNYIGGLRWALRWAGLLRDQAPAKPPTDGPWHILLESLNCTFAVIGLAYFATWCGERGIKPDEVNDSTLAAFEDMLRTVFLQENPRKKVGNIAKSWRRPVRAGVVSSSMKLTAPNRRKAYTLPFTDFPRSLQTEIAAFETRLAGGEHNGPFCGEGPAVALEASSIASRVFSLRQALSALVAAGRPAATITSLSILVEEPNFVAIMTHYWKHAIALKVQRGELVAGQRHPREAGVTAQTAAIAGALMMVARYHAKLDAKEIAKLTALAKKMRTAVPMTINVKIRRMLDALSVPATRLALMTLPEKLMTIATRLVASDLPEKDRRPLEAARMALVATAIKIELMLPIRIGNLTRLRLTDQIQRLGHRSSVPDFLMIPLDDVKNDKEIEWPIDPETGAMIARFVRDFRPLLQPGDGVHIFPRGHGDRTGHRSVDAIRAGITQAIEEHVGVKMHVHGFRAFIASMTLEQSPDAREDVKAILGHKTLLTADKYYAYMQPKHAAARLAALMDRARQGSVAGTARPSRTTGSQWAAPVRKLGKPRK